MPRTTTRSTAVSFLRFALWAAAAFGLLFVALGLFVVALDTSSHDDEWDGLGRFFGSLMAAAGVLWFIPHAALAVLIARVAHTRRLLKPVAAAATALGALLLAFGLYYAASGSAEFITMLPEIGMSLAVVLAGLGVLADDSSAGPSEESQVKPQTNR